MLDDLSVAHIAVAVPELKSAVSSLADALNLTASAPEVVESERVRLQFLKIGGVRFEFLEPLDSKSPISKFLEKRGSGVHHVALYVNNLEEKLVELKKKGLHLINETPKTGAEGCKIAFLHPKSTGGILIELIEK